MTDDEIKKFEEINEKINYLENRLEIEKARSKRNWSGLKLSAWSGLELYWFLTYCKEPSKLLLTVLILCSISEVCNLIDFYNDEKNFNNQIKETYKVYKKEL